jgi:hypothetical protein
MILSTDVASLQNRLNKQVFDAGPLQHIHQDYLEDLVFCSKFFLQ